MMEIVLCRNGVERKGKFRHDIGAKMEDDGVAIVSQWRGACQKVTQTVSNGRVVMLSRKRRKRW